MKKIAILIFTFLFLLSVKADDNTTFARFPSLSPDGSTIAFSYQGDIWTVPVNGGKAFRLTIHQAYESNPKWSPDGKKIAFSSNRFGQNDIFIVNSEGGIPKRITNHSAGNILSDWSSSGKLLFQSNRNYRQVEWEFELQCISAQGGTPSRLIDAFGREPVISPNGRFIAFVKGECRIEREQYKGSANKDIWLYDTQLKTYKKHTSFVGQDYHPVWGSNNVLYFISSRNEKYNIFSLEIDKNGNSLAKPKQITYEKTDQIRFFDVSNDYKTIIFEKDVNLYSVSTEGGAIKKIIIDIATDYRFDPFETKTFSDKISEYEVSPNGKYSAFIIHGEVFITENDKKKSLTKNLSNSPQREKNISWLNDSALIFSSDRNGQYDLFMVKSSDNKQTNLLKSLKHQIIQLTKGDEDERYAKVSIDGKKIVFIRGGNFGKMKFIVADIDKNGLISNEKVLLEDWSAPDRVKWSPDSRWLAYSKEDLTFNAEIYILAADGSQKPVNVSMHPRRDYSPIWSSDGSKLGFISARNNLNDDIWFVWLKKEDSQKTSKDWEEEEDEEKPKEPVVKKDEKSKRKEKGKDKSEDDELKPIEIDFENIYERLVQLTSLSGDERNLAISKDGKTFYFSSLSPGNKEGDLFKIKWDKKELESVTKGGVNPRSVKIDNAGKFVYMNLKGKLSRISTSGKEMESLPVAAKIKIDYKAELNQVFDEAWRTLRDGFYDPEFHGQNWDSLKLKFRPYCLKASTKTDFMYMFNTMLGQLNASHMGLYGSDREKTQSEKTGLLGIDIRTLSTGVEIIRVVPDSPADKINSKLNKGDVILAVNGNFVNEKVNFWSLLANTVQEKILLQVKNKDGVQREVIIRPVSSLKNELYNEWVKDRRKLTEQYSGGKLGYLHIRGMDMTSFERFERELTAAGYGKEAIVIDVRYNGGGWTTDYLMAVLNVKQHAYTIPRGAESSLSNNKKYRNYYPFSERLPFFVWNKPSIAICNAASYSNAEIFSHAYKNLDIGTLVGKPTFGAVISTGGLGLLDGSFVRMPFRGWFVKANDMNMDKEPARPDIDIDNSPDYRAKGVDEQLKKACEVLLEQIQSPQK